MHPFISTIFKILYIDFLELSALLVSCWGWDKLT